MNDIAVRSEPTLRWPLDRGVIAAITQGISDGVLIAGSDGSVLFLNPAAERILGWTQAEVVGAPLHEVVHLGFGALASHGADACPLLDCTHSGRPRLDQSDTFLHANGATFHVTYTSIPLTIGEYGTGAVVTIRDTTSPQGGASTSVGLEEAAIRLAHRRVRALFEQSPMGIITYEPDGTLFDANKAVLETLTLDQTAGYNVLSDKRLIDAGLMEGIKRAFAGEATMLPPIYFDPSRVPGAPNGRARWMRGFLYPVKDDAGRVCEVVAMVEDITDQHLAEDRLRETEAQYHAIFEATSDGLVITDMDGTIVEVNPSVCAMHGYAYDEFVRLSPRRFIHADYRHLIATCLHTVEQGNLFQNESVHVRRDGSTFPVEVHGTSFTYRGAPHVLIIVRDTTERVEAYQRLEQRVEERTRELSSLLDVSHSVASTLELEPLLGLILDHLKAVVDYSGASIQILDGDTVTVLDYRGPAPREQIVGLSYPLDGTKVEQAVVRGRDPVIVEDVRGQTALASAYYSATRNFPGHVRSWMGVPLLLKDRVLGLLTLAYREPGCYAAHHAALALAMANQAAVAIENARLYQKAQQSAAQEERQRLARELHDAVTQTLFSASLIAEVVPRLWDRDPEAGRQRLEDVRLLTQGALAEMRTLLLELRPAALTEAKLADLLRQLAAAFTGRKRVPVALALDGGCTVPPDVQVALYRVAQEALNNAAKHAKAGAIDVRLRCRNERVELLVADNGRVFEPSRIGSDHFGLRIMRERADAIGAKLTIWSQPATGTRIRVVWSGPKIGMEE